MTKQNNPKWKAAFFGKCPKCGEGKLFNGIVKLADECNSCKLDLTTFETADGPAFFAISIVGTIVGITAGVTEIIHSPSVITHLALWTPSIFLGSFWIMRVTKGLMIAHQFQLEK